MESCSTKDFRFDNNKEITKTRNPMGSVFLASNLRNFIKLSYLFFTIMLRWHGQYSEVELYKCFSIIDNLFQNYMHVENVQFFF